MSLLSDARKDLATAPMQPRSYEDDQRGPTHGKKWQDAGEPVECAYQDLDTQERFEAGRQESDRMLKLYADLTTEEKSPVTERNRVVLLGVEYDVTAVQTIVAPRDRGAIIEVVSV